MKHVIIHTDGACSGNPPWWAAILKYGRHERELSGGKTDHKNNRMELTAAISTRGTDRTVPGHYSDSSYLVNGMTKGWAESWQKERAIVIRQKARA